MGSGWTRSPVWAERTCCRLLFAGTCTSFHISLGPWQPDGSAQAFRQIAFVAQWNSCQYGAVAAVARGSISRSCIYSTDIMRTCASSLGAHQHLGTSGPNHCCSTSFCNPAALLLGMLVAVSSAPTSRNYASSLKFSWEWSLEKKVDGALSKTFTVSRCELYCRSLHLFELKTRQYSDQEASAATSHCRFDHHSFIHVTPVAGHHGVLSHAKRACRQSLRVCTAPLATAPIATGLAPTAFIACLMHTALAVGPAEPAAICLPCKHTAQHTTQCCYRHMHSLLILLVSSAPYPKAPLVDPSACTMRLKLAFASCCACCCVLQAAWGKPINLPYEITIVKKPGLQSGQVAIVKFEVSCDPPSTGVRLVANPKILPGSVTDVPLSGGMGAFNLPWDYSELQPVVTPVGTVVAQCYNNATAQVGIDVSIPVVFAKADTTEVGDTAKATDVVTWPDWAANVRPGTVPVKLPKTTLQGTPPDNAVLAAVGGATFPFKYSYEVSDTLLCLSGAPVSYTAAKAGPQRPH